MRAISLALVASFAFPAAAATALPDWAGTIRKDHPRLFFNAETWPEVRARALDAEKDWYERTKARVDRLRRDLEDGRKLEGQDLGPLAARAAFVFRVTGEEAYLDLARVALARSLDFYEECFDARRTVNWYSTSRVHAVLAWDWLYEELPDSERRGTMSRLVRVLENVFTAKPPIHRENISGYSTGFYGVPNTKWFIGCTAHGTGIEEALVGEWLVWGHEENLKMLAHRKAACGDDGGSASPTVGYAFGAYPWAEQNFIYTWRSATGEDLAPAWPHAAWLANYVIWNWIETGASPREFGYGDTPHVHNRLPIGELWTHMANVRHLFGRSEPEAAALARHLQERLPAGVRNRSEAWFIYPFLWSGLESSPPPLASERLPRARNFEQMGQIFLRSGTGPDDTYCLFTCGGTLDQHRHYDALNFVIYHKGHLALDSGTRYREEVNGQHLANYFAQTVAHNCVLIHQDGEPPARYWGGTVQGSHGGQHRSLGSVVRAFAPRDRYVYVAGDGTASYLHRGRSGRGEALPQKVSLVTRQVVFILPRHFVIFDRVAATDPAYRKEWLLHTANEPAIEGKTFRVDQEGGRLFCRALLPADGVLVAVGGPGREFQAAGRNWSIDASGLGPEELAMIGRWRVEVRPGAARAEDVFLHVVEVGDRNLASMTTSELIESDGSAGVRIHAGPATWEVTFRTRGELGGRIRMEADGTRIDERLASEVEPQQGILPLRAGR